jgi:uncharacterized protein YjbI with pentapeptide repeats
MSNHLLINKKTAISAIHVVNSINRIAAINQIQKHLIGNKNLSQKIFSVVSKTQPILSQLNEDPTVKPSLDENTMNPLLTINGYRIAPGADLFRAPLDNKNLIDAKLNGADLRGARLYKANLTGANLTGANLMCARLCQTKLIKSNLTYADLRFTNLTKAYLTSANLTGANLTSADLRGADLSATDLTGANLTDIILSNATNITKSKLTMSSKERFVNCKGYSTATFV